MGIGHNLQKNQRAGPNYLHVLLGMLEERDINMGEWINASGLA